MAATGLYTAVRQQTRLNGQIITYVCVLVIFKKSTLDTKDNKSVDIS